MKTSDLMELGLLKDAKLSFKLVLHQWSLSHFHVGGSNNRLSGINIKPCVHLLVENSEDHRQCSPLKCDFKK